jgi:hypothetical protein
MKNKLSKIMWLGIGVIIVCISLALVMFVFLLQWIVKGIVLLALIYILFKLFNGIKNIKKWY